MADSMHEDPRRDTTWRSARACTRPGTAAVLGLQLVSHFTLLKHCINIKLNGAPSRMLPHIHAYMQKHMVGRLLIAWRALISLKQLT